MASISGTIRDLLIGSAKIGHKGVQRRVAITSLNPIMRNKQLVVKAISYGTKIYELTYIINGIEYVDQPDANHRLPVYLKHSKFYCSSATMDSKIQVRCTCADFYYTWWYWNSKNKNLSGPKMKPYIRKTTTYPERNPIHVPGMCKHLIQLTDKLKSQYIIK